MIVNLYFYHVVPQRSPQRPNILSVFRLILPVAVREVR